MANTNGQNLTLALSLSFRVVWIGFSLFVVLSRFSAMMESSCAESFKNAFECFVGSDKEGEDKGAECMDNFRALQECIAEHADEFLDDDDKKAIEEAGKSEAAGGTEEDSKKKD